MICQPGLRAWYNKEVPSKSKSTTTSYKLQLMVKSHSVKWAGRKSWQMLQSLVYTKSAHQRLSDGDVGWEDKHDVDT